MRILDKHGVRAMFYHMVSIVFLTSTGLWFFGHLSDKTSYILTATLFVVDYIAEMYDPHPKNPGPWYRYFHRAFEINDEKYITNNCACECTC